MGQRADLLTNDPLFTADYATYNVEVVKRLTGRSQILTGLDVSHYDTWGFASAFPGHRHRYGELRRAAGSQPPDLQQPSRLLALAVQVPGQLRAPVGDFVVGVVRLNKGEPYGRTLNTTGLNQGTVNLTVEPIGTFFYSTVRLVDLRFAKSVPIGKGSWKGCSTLQLDELAGHPEREHPDRRELWQRAVHRESAHRALGARWSF